MRNCFKPRLHEFQNSDLCVRRGSTRHSTRLAAIPSQGPFHLLPATAPRAVWSTAVRALFFLCRQGC